MKSPEDINPSNPSNPNEITPLKNIAANFIVKKLPKPIIDNLPAKDLSKLDNETRKENLKSIVKETLKSVRKKPDPPLCANDIDIPDDIMNLIITALDKRYEQIEVINGILRPYHLQTLARDYVLGYDHQIDIKKSLSSWFYEALLPYNNFGSLCSVRNHQIFSLAAEHGLLKLMQCWVKDDFIFSKNELLTNDNYLVFRYAAENGHLDILEWIREIAEGDIPQMLAADGYYAFRYAAANGHLDILKWIVEKAPNDIPQMLAANKYHAFRYAAGNGHLNILEWIVGIADKAPGDIPQMLAEMSHAAFCCAAANGRFDILKWIYEKYKYNISRSLERDISAFTFATERNRVDIVKWLVDKYPEGTIPQILLQDDYLEFRCIVEYGCIDVLKWMVKQVPNDIIPQMLAAGDFDIFCSAAAYGYLDILEWVVDIAPDDIPKMLAANDYLAFRGAAANGYLDILEWIVDIAPDDIPKMLAANDYLAFRRAAANGKLDILEWIVKKAPNEIPQMLAAFDYDAFTDRKRNGIIEDNDSIFSYLWNLSTEEDHIKIRGIYANKGITLPSYCSLPMIDLSQDLFFLLDSDVAKNLTLFPSFNEIDYPEELYLDLEEISELKRSREEGSDFDDNFRPSKK